MGSSGIWPDNRRPADRSPAGLPLDSNLRRSVEVVFSGQIRRVAPLFGTKLVDGRACRPHLYDGRRFMAGRRA